MRDGFTIMTFHYHPESDMLYIKLADVPSTESEEVAPGIVLDFDAGKRVVGIEIEDASRSADLSRSELLPLPFKDVVLGEKRPAQS